MVGAFAEAEANRRHECWRPSPRRTLTHRFRHREDGEPGHAEQHDALCEAAGPALPVGREAPRRGARKADRDEQWRREAPELDRSPMGVVGRISRLAQLLQAELEPIFAAHGVNGGAFDVLAALRRAGRPYRLTPTALSKALMVTSGGMTKRLTALERPWADSPRARSERRTVDGSVADGRG
jgi:hypothetical protein